ncbi:hypothetical protein [Sphingobacterium sp.]
MTVQNYGCLRQQYGSRNKRISFYFFEDDLIGAESWIGIIRKFGVDEEKI